MKIIRILFGSVFPVLCFVVLALMLNMITGIFTDFFSTKLDGMALPQLTVFVISQKTLITLMLIGLSLVFLVISFLLPSFIKNHEGLMLSYAIYHAAILATVVTVLGAFIMALTLPLVQAA